MDRKAEEFRTRLLATFKVEAGEHIRALSSGLLELEQSSPGEHAAVLETIFREAHSLKGAARAVNVSSIESICQSLEGVFSSWQRKDIVPSPSLFDLLQRAASFLEEILLSLEAGSVPVDTSLATSLIESLEKARKGVEPLSPPHSEPPSVKSELSSRATAKGKSLQLDTVRIPVARLDALLWEAEELLSAKLSVSQRAADARAIRGSFAQWKKTRAEARPYLRLLSHESNDDRNGPGEGKKKRQDQLRRFLTLLEQDDASFNALEGRFGALEKSAQRDQRAIERTVNQLLESMKKIVMLPASSLLESFPKLVRDLALEQGKPVELVIQGAEIEVDRRILESMKDPLRHLVRNCVDHGIESAIERERTGKPTRGSIIISLRRKDSDKVELLISDDGAGIQKEKIRTTALKVGACSPDEIRAMDDRETLALIFCSGVSTSPIITDISGRGLGLAIVREKVEKLGGEVSLETEPGRGTSFRIVLPLTRAAFRGVVIRVDHHLFVLPTTHVEKVFRFRSEEIKTVENRDTVSVGGRLLVLVRMRDALELPAPRSPSGVNGTRQAVLLGSGGRRIAFEVDEILSEQEVLAKALGKQLPRVRNVAGATVLGTGKVVPILEVSDLLRSAVSAGTRSPVAPLPSAEAGSPRRSILVAEDSITARTLLKSILESAGFDVQTAVDGAEAFVALKTATFDLVVSDVDMPRMNGFALTAKIRGDAKLAELPVVLVTALGSREDRERGIDAGANAYIVKSSFDQSDLLEVVRRLL